MHRVAEDVQTARNKTVTGKSLLFFVGLAIVIGVTIGLIHGWQYSFIGLGAGLGPLIGAYFGNKKAAEVDAYRDAWLGKRKALRESHATEIPTD